VTRAADGLRVGARVGLCWGLAEIFAGYAFGDRLPWTWWAFQAVAWCPSLALLGLCSSLFGFDDALTSCLCRRGC
jgi:hypothetical protein